MSIPPRFLDEIRSRVSVSEIVGRTVKLTKMGREHKGCCPFHHEKTPSFTVNDDKQFYHCFGCGAHGDVINFLQQNSNLSFVEAVEILAAQAGLQVPKSTPQEVERSKKAKDLYELMESATQFMQDQLKNPAHHEVLEYAQTRGLKGKVLEEFRIGYAPADRQALRKHLITQGFTDKDMMEAGVIKPSTKGGEPYAFFNDRLIFPVTDPRGRVIAFGGRALPEHMRPPNQSNFKPPKYINSGDTALFDKGRALYAMAQARQASGEGKPIIVTEGYMDVIACRTAGFRGAVAPMGTALTEEQIVLIWKIIAEHEKMPILCFDGDNAGRKAAARAAERVLPLLRPGHSVRFAFLPEGKDPDDLIKESGAAEFQKIIDSAISLMDFLWMLHTATRDLSTPEARAGVSKDLRDTISKITDPEVQRHYNAFLQERISQTFFPRRPFEGKQNRPAPKQVIKPQSIRFKNTLPKALIAAVLNYPGIYHDIEEEFSCIDFAHASFNRLRQSMASCLSSSEPLDRTALQDHLKKQGYDKEMDDILNESVYVHAAFARPGHEEDSVRAKWKENFALMKGGAVAHEIREGWKKAYENANEEEARMLSSMICGANAE